MLSFRAFANRFLRGMRRRPPVSSAPVATPEQAQLSWAYGLLAAAVTETQMRADRVDCGPCDWTNPNAYWKDRPMAIVDDFDDFIARLRAMSDEDVAMAYRFEGGAGPRADIIAAEMRRRGGIA